MNQEGVGVFRLYHLRVLAPVLTSVVDRTRQNCGLPIGSVFALWFRLEEGLPLTEQRPRDFIRKLVGVDSPESVSEPKEPRYCSGADFFLASSFDFLSSPFTFRAT